MLKTRRYILAFAGNAFAFRLLGALPTPAPKFDVDRLLDANSADHPNTFSRKYICNATVTLFSLPLVTKSGVGSGYTVIEEAACPSGNTISIQFGAGSWPESARGLNRLGFIQEAILEESAGKPAECAYVAFMTTSQEKSLDQAKKALETSGAIVPYSAAQGYSGHGHIASRVDRLQFPSKLTWRDIPVLVSRARGEMAADSQPKKDLPVAPGTPGTPATFLYVVRAALRSPAKHTKGHLFFNSKQFLLETDKEQDPAVGAHFAGRKIVANADKVMKLSATLTERHTGEKTPFHLWYEAGAEQMPPLRFDYQAKSFLRLTFEADTAAPVPPIRLALAGSKENA